jgi:hypothetical protein
MIRVATTPHFGQATDTISGSYSYPFLEITPPPHPRSASACERRASGTVSSAIRAGLLAHDDPHHADDLLALRGLGVIPD